MAGEGIGELNIDKAREYVANASRVGGALEALKRHDGWQIFLALFYRVKKEYGNKKYGSDHDALVEFKGDRRAIELVEDLFAEMDGLIEDANEAANLGDIGGEEEQPRGILLIEAMEGSNRETL